MSGGDLPSRILAVEHTLAHILCAGADAASADAVAAALLELEELSESNQVRTVLSGAADAGNRLRSLAAGPKAAIRSEGNGLTTYTDCARLH